MLRDSPTDQEHRQESLRSRIRLIQARQKGERSAEDYAKELGMKGQTGLSNLRVSSQHRNFQSKPLPVPKPRRNGAKTSGALGRSSAMALAEGQWVYGDYPAYRK